MAGADIAYERLQAGGMGLTVLIEGVNIEIDVLMSRQLYKDIHSSMLLLFEKLGQVREQKTKEVVV